MHGVKTQFCLAAFSVMVLAALATTQQRTASESTLPSLSDEELRKLRYHVLETRPLFACDAAPPEALTNRVERALTEFPAIRKDKETFQVITRHLGLEKLTEFGPDEKLLVYCDYETLKAMHLEPSGNKYKVVIGANPPPLPEGVSQATGIYIDREGHIENLIVGMSAGGAVSPPIRDMPPAKWAPPPEPPIHIDALVHPELRYRLVDRFGALLCPDDSGPARNWTQVRQRILETLPQIQQDQPTFRLIAQHLGLGGLTKFSDEQKIAVYHEYSKLHKIRLELLVNKFQFMLTAPTEETHHHGIGALITGLIAPHGEILVLDTQAYRHSCPK